MSQKSFKDFSLSNATLTALSQRGFFEPTTIQNAVIPRLLKGAWHVVGQAQTGTGKTAAFAIPIIEKTTPNSTHTTALVILPTRELALQCAVEMRSLVGHRRINIAPIYGGVSFSNQVRELHRAHVVVATPGRLLDHVQQGTVRLDHLSYLVLDEADEMLSMGFIQDIETILKYTNDNKQVLMFSATFPEPLHAIAQQYMSQYEYIKVDASSLTNNNVEQHYIQVISRDRLLALQRIIDLHNDFYGIVFCSTKIEVDQVTAQLTQQGFATEGLHGDISQANRERTLDKFKKHLATVLVATDIAARGIDVKNVSHVINYSIPRTQEIYVHRIGRTGRAGQKGVAITLVVPSELPRLHRLERNLGTRIEPLLLPHGEDMVAHKISALRDELYTLAHQKKQSDTYNELAGKLLQHWDAQDVVTALLRYYDTNGVLLAKRYPKIQMVRRNEDELVDLFFARGKEHNMTVEKLTQFIATKLYLDERLIENVKVMQSYSFFSAPRKDADAILDYFHVEGMPHRSLVRPAHYKKSKE